MAGYSGTPLVRKLGIRSGMRLAVLGAPIGYASLVADLPADVVVLDAGDDGPADFVHLFVREAAALEVLLPRLRERIAPDGMIWVSWPKRASKVPTDVTGDVVRAKALAARLVDVKVCAVDAVWSGLKLVIRREDRG